MIITISGTPGSGKSTLAKNLARKLGLKHYSTGDLMREMAAERHISLMELSKIAEKDRSIDEELDQRQIGLGKTEDDFIIDGRLSFHFIPDSIKIFITASQKERAERILADNIRKENNISFESTLKDLKRREISEKRRYKKYYNLDYTKKLQYDLVIDNTGLQAEDGLRIAMDFLKKKRIVK